jgi:hypothetical protein
MLLRITFRRWTWLASLTGIGNRIFLGDYPPDPPGSLRSIDRSERSKSSYFLGDPPPDPRFLASLSALSLVQPHTKANYSLLRSGLRMFLTNDSEGQRSEPHGVSGDFPWKPRFPSQQAKRAIVF